MAQKYWKMVMVDESQCPDLQIFIHLLSAIEFVQVSPLQSQVCVKTGEGDLPFTNTDI